MIYPFTFLKDNTDWINVFMIKASNKDDLEGSFKLQDIIADKVNQYITLAANDHFIHKS